MTVGLHASHAFLIIDINKVTNNYTCGACLAMFKRADALTRQVKTCTRRKPKWPAPATRLRVQIKPMTRPFFTHQHYGYNAIRWIEYESRQLYGHGGERLIAGGFVDGYHQESKTVFQFHGCYFHGCSWCYRRERQNEVLYTDCKGKQITRAHVYQRTLPWSQTLRNCGYTVVRAVGTRGRWWIRALPLAKGSDSHQGKQNLPTRYWVRLRGLSRQD